MMQIHHSPPGKVVATPDTALPDTKAGAPPDTPVHVRQQPAQPSRVIPAGLTPPAGLPTAGDTAVPGPARLPGKKKNRNGLLQPLYLRRESKTKLEANFTLGQGTAARADRLGRSWVGKRGGPWDGVAGGLVSEDGRRIYRPPTQKSFRPDTVPTARQANFLLLDDGDRVIANGHYDIRD